MEEPLIDDNEDELFCGAEESKLNLDKAGLGLRVRGSTQQALINSNIEPS